MNLILVKKKKGGFNLLLYCWLMFVSRSAFKLDDLGVEIATIALPAAMALTADPIASLIDTAFIGQIGIIISFTY